VLVGERGRKLSDARDDVPEGRESRRHAHRFPAWLSTGTYRYGKTKVLSKTSNVK